MKAARLNRHALILITLSAFLAGCSGTQNALGVAPSSVSPNVSHVPHTGALLYVSNVRSAKVEMFSYPQVKTVGSFDAPGVVRGLCSDAAGNVWVTVGLSATPELVEYAHGGTTPIATLSLSADIVPELCAVDPLTNNLAVAVGPGEVLIFQDEAGAPQTYYDSAFAEIYSLTYDTHGDLFIYGINTAGSSRNPLLGELVSGSSEFSNATFNHQVILSTFAQWRGHDILLGGITKLTGRRGNRMETETVWRVAASSSGLKVVGRKTFEAPTRPGIGIGPSAWLQGNTLLQQDSSGNEIYFFAYPSGGRSIKELHIHDGYQIMRMAVST